MTIREVNINDADALSDIYKYYVDNFPYSFEYVAPSAEEFSYCPSRNRRRICCA